MQRLGLPRFQKKEDGVVCAVVIAGIVGRRLALGCLAAAAMAVVPAPLAQAVIIILEIDAYAIFLSKYIYFTNLKYLIFINEKSTLHVLGFFGRVNSEPNVPRVVPACRRARNSVPYIRCVFHNGIM
jgi:glycosyltransferase involved in cell wall biosynthesis